MNDTTKNINKSNQEGLNEVMSAFNNNCFIDGLNCKYYTETEFASNVAKHKGLSQSTFPKWMVSTFEVSGNLLD